MAKRLRRHKPSAAERLALLVRQIGVMEAAQARQPLGASVPEELRAARQQARRWGGPSWRQPAA